MKLPKTFKKMAEKDRIKYAMRKKMEYEKKADFWTSICRKLTSNKDFTPAEIDLIDTLLEKEYPVVKDYSTVKIGVKEGAAVLMEKLKKDS